MSDLIKVEGSDDLARDPNSGAIVNTNVSAYQNALRVHKLNQERDKQLVSLQNDINNMKETVNELVMLLKENRGN
jgi:hypothetical protein